MQHADLSLIRRLADAVEKLACGRGNQRDRLSASVLPLQPLLDRDFPEHLRPAWRQLETALGRPAAEDAEFLVEYCGLWVYNINRMHWRERKRCSELIFELHLEILTSNYAR
jgi:hypothetical protein